MTLCCFVALSEFPAVACTRVFYKRASYRDAPEDRAADSSSDSFEGGQQIRAGERSDEEGFFASSSSLLSQLCAETRAHTCFRGQSESFARNLRNIHSEGRRREPRGTDTNAFTPLEATSYCVCLRIPHSAFRHQLPPSQVVVLLSTRHTGKSHLAAFTVKRFDLEKIPPPPTLARK